MLLCFAAAGGQPVRAADPVVDPKQVHTARGVIREISPDRHRAIIKHEAIVNYMPAMTMEFNVRDTNELSGVAAGDTVTFRLTATDDTHWIDHVRKLATATNRVAVPAMHRQAATGLELKVGDLLPDGLLLDENGRRIRFTDFRGRALAFTFFFTRCPLPDFCPLMNRHFADARGLLLADAHAPTNWQFLSISFDPDVDRPNVLARYATNYRGSDSDWWLFAAAPTNTLAELAPHLDLMVTRDGAGFSHNLRTVVLDTQGRIHRQFDGNQWTAEELAKAIAEASGVPRPKP